MAAGRKVTGAALASGGAVAAIAAAAAVWFFGLWQPHDEGASPIAQPAAVAALPALQPVPQALTPSAPPATPSDDVAAPAPQNVAPSVDTFHLAEDGAALLAGRAPGAKRVELSLDGAALHAGPVTATGSFALMFTLPPSDLARALSLRAYFDGDVVLAAKDQILIAPRPRPQPEPPAAVAESAPAVPPPALAQEAPRIASLALPSAIAVSDLGEVRSLAPVAKGAVAIDAIRYSGTDLVEISGRGPGPGEVRIYLDNALKAETEAGADGAWRSALNDVAPGLYTLRADQSDAAGKVVARSETAFKREDPATLGAQAQGPGPSVVTVQPGFTLWRIARDSYGEGLAYVKVFEANRDQIRNADLIYPGQVFTVPKPD